MGRLDNLDYPGDDIIVCHCGCGRRYKAGFEIEYGNTIRTYVKTIDPIILKKPNEGGVYIEHRSNGPYIQCTTCGMMGDECGHICFQVRPSWVKPWDYITTS